MAVQTIDRDELARRMEGLDGWTLLEGKLHRAFAFGDFVEAFSFMTSVALLAESANHHPEWSNVYRKVTIDLSTHEAGGITERDLALAAAIDALPAVRT